MLEGFHNKQLTFNTFALGFFQFIGVFIGSAFVGALVGILIALVLKYSDLHKTPSLESCVVTLLAFMSYFMANVFQFTGPFIYISIDVNFAVHFIVSDVCT